MSDRTTDIATFLNRIGWGNARRAPLAGDASPRRYERLTLDGQTRVLMDAPPDRGEDVRPFVAIARHLSGLGLSAPAIHAEDTANGFLLLEDLGDDLYARLIPQTPALEPELYAAAVDVLAEIQRHPPPVGLPHYDAAAMVVTASLALEWYAPAAGGAPDAAAFRAELADLLTNYAGGPQVVTLRDYHAENLIWLPDHDGLARVGLLDFQNAELCHPAYDLISLLEDARRDVPAEVDAAMRARFAAATGIAPEALAVAAAALGAQRNLRILGVFVRLWLRDGKPRYLPLLPRVWGHLQRDLSHPALARLAGIVAAGLPAPTPEVIERIRQCAPRPMP
jgi:N-acetylmuramate 1-kinase